MFGQPEMKRIAWVNDIHLSFVEKDQRLAFAEAVAWREPDAVLVGGDIAEGPTFEYYLLEMAELLCKPIYFVLGNHDFYGTSVASARQAARQLGRTSEYLQYLPDVGPVELTPQTALVGHDGWADGRLGDYQRSDVLLNDYFVIEDLAWLGPPQRLAKLHELGDEAAGYFRRVLPKVLETYRRVLLVTHVPPFRESAWHEGAISSDDWLPHMSCKAVGEVLVDLMARHRDVEMTVLCGHTHGRGEATILENLRVLTGGARYGHPAVGGVIEVE